MKAEQFWELFFEEKPPQPLTEKDFQELGLLEIWQRFNELEKKEKKHERIEVDFFPEEEEA